MIIIEDVDSMFHVDASSLEEEEVVAASKKKSGRKTLKLNTPRTVAGKQKETLANITAALDGIGSPENCIIIMTTNHHEDLPEALTRAGRCNETFDFGLADAYQIRKLFRRFFNHTVVSKEGYRVDEIFDSGLEDQFCQCVEPHVYPPAFIEQHLIKYIDHPSEAIAQIHVMKREFELNQIKEEERQEEVESPSLVIV